MDETELTEAVSRLDGMIDAADRDDVGELMRAARAFIAYVSRHSGNAVLTRVMSDAAPLLERNVRRARLDQPPLAARAVAYRGLREAMLARDADAAERWLRGLHDPLVI
jgi:DNA-binding GntR family transcriptional regulator